MNATEAKEVLILYRPGTADDHDPAFVDALDYCQRDPELKSWFDGHCEVYRTLRQKFRELPVPEALKEQIVAERDVRPTVLWRSPALLVAVAVVALLVGGLSWWLRSREDTGFPKYVDRMVSLALLGYTMPVATNDPAQIRQYLTANRAPGDYAIPAALEKATLMGCSVEGWQNVRVALICFDSGRPHPAGQQNDLWMFVIDSRAVSGGPRDSTPSFAQVNRTMTASWTKGGKTYLLVADGDATLLRKYL